MLNYDVVVVGGGTSGAIAALSAARSQNCKVLLVESGSHIGGLAGIGMTWGGFFDNNFKQVIGGIPDELVKKCKEIAGRGYFQYHGDGDKWISGLASVDPEAMRYVVEKELYAAGCDIMLFSTISGAKYENNRVTEIEVVSKLGKKQISAKYFIDATGDLTFADMVGVKWEHGENGFTQCTSNMFRVLGVNMDEYEEYLQEHINTEAHDPWKKETGAIRRGIEYWCPWKPDGFEEMPKSLGIYYHGKNNDVILNCTATSIDPLDIMAISKGSFKLREEAFKVVDYLKKNVKGFENSYISEVYDIGVRESRRMLGEYMITIEDVVDHTKFEDSIGMGAYPPDVHNPDGQVHISLTTEFKNTSDGAYDIPLRSLLAGFENLLVVGRCISATFQAESALRGIGPCMVEGQGAGTAVAYAIKHNISDIHNVEYSALHKELENQGVIFI